MVGAMSTAPANPARLFALAGSAFVVLAAEPLYVLVDTAVVGHLGEVALGGVGIAGTLLALVTMIGGFLEYGTTARAARWYGAGRLEDAVAEGAQATWLAVFLGLGGVGIGQAVAGPLTRALAGGATPTQAAAEEWLRIAVCGLPLVLIVVAGNGWLRGVQDTRTPIRVVLLANAVSAALCPVLVYPVGWGVAGSAVANVAAQALGAALFVRALLRATPQRRPHWRTMRAQLVIGRDLLLREVGFHAAFLTSAGVAARMGAAQVAAHQIALQLWTFLALVLDSFAIAAQSLVGAALGGSDPAEARRTAWRVARLGLVVGVVIAGLLALGHDAVPAVFTSSEAVREQAQRLWPWFVAMMPAAGVVFALDGVLIGAGDVAFMRNLTLVGALLVFVPLDLLALHLGWGIGGVWAGLTGFVLVRLVGMVVRCAGTRWLVVGETRVG
ncbi:MATE family efflux transporter [Jatrophihabitans sp. YIM 134969]